MKRILAFAMAGGAGFAADAFVLFSLTAGGGLDPFSARLVSVGVAILLTWLLNRRHTFAASGRSVLGEGARYGAVAVAVAGFNYLAYAALLLVFPGLWPLGALAAASGASMALSFLGYSRLVFSPGSATRNRSHPAI